MNSGDDTCLTPNSMGSLILHVKSHSAPNIISGETSTANRPVLRTISNLSSSEKKPHSANLKLEKNHSRKSSLKIVPNDRLKHDDKVGFELHPFDNVTLYSKLESLSPHTPLSKFLIKKALPIPTSPLAVNQVAVLDDDNIISLNENFQIEHEKGIAKQQLKWLSDHGALTISLIDKFSDVINIKDLNLSKSFGVKYEFPELFMLLSSCPSESYINNLFSLISTKETIISYLEYLNISSLVLSIRHFSLLRSMTKLTYLNISNTSITDQHIEALASTIATESSNSSSLLYSLTTIDISENLLVTDESFEFLRKFPNLEHINLNRTSVTLDGLVGFMNKQSFKLLSFKSIKIPSNILSELYSRRNSIICTMSFYEYMRPDNILLFDEASIDRMTDKRVLLHQLGVFQKSYSNIIFSIMMSMIELKDVLKRKFANKNGTINLTKKLKFCCDKGNQWHSIKEEDRKTNMDRPFFKQPVNISKTQVSQIDQFASNPLPAYSPKNDTTLQTKYCIPTRGYPNLFYNTSTNSPLINAQENSNYFHHSNKLKPHPQDPLNNRIEFNFQNVFPTVLFNGLTKENKPTLSNKDVEDHQIPFSSKQAFCSNDCNSNASNILSEIWGISVPFSNQQGSNSHRTNDVKPSLFSENLLPCPTIITATPLIASPKTTSSKPFFRSAQGPPPGFSSLPLSNTDTTQVLAKQSSAVFLPTSLAHLESNATISLLSLLLEEYTNIEIEAMSNIFIPFNLLKPNTNHNSIISALVAEHADVAFTPCIKNSTGCQYLNISLLPTSDTLSITELKEKTKSILCRWLQNLPDHQAKSFNSFSKLVFLRRSLISKLSIPIDVEVYLSLEQMKLISDLDKLFLRQVSDITFVKIQLRNTDSFSSRLFLTGDSEGVDIVYWILNEKLKFSPRTEHCMPRAKPSHNATILIPRCFHSPMIGIAGARLQAILKASGNGSVRVSFPRLMSSPSWEVKISSSGYNMCKDSVEKVRQALVNSWRAMVIMSIRQRCSCDALELTPQVFENDRIEPFHAPSGPGTPDAPGLLYSHIVDCELPEEVLLSKQHLSSVHLCDFQRLVRQTGIKIRLYNGGTLNDNNSEAVKNISHHETKPKTLNIELSGLPISHLLQVELILTWINAERKSI